MNIYLRKQTIPVENTYCADLLHNIPKLSDEKKKKEYTTEELENAIRKSKLNKSPGPTGFTKEF